MSDATIGRYRLDKQLGKGSMGEVYRAHDPELDRRVAIKTIRLDSPLFEDDTEEVIARFQTEARAAARLSHPNIVTVYDFGEEQGLYYLVMEYVEGQTLGKRLAGGALPAGEAATVVQQTCDALTAAHEAGIVHRDIKPGNLMVDSATGLVKVMDFGIAKVEISNLTQTGVIIGTPRYMSPEQIQGQPVDRRSDLFSLGAVYAEALTGELLFSGSDMTVISHQILNEEPTQIADVEANLGEGPAWVLRRALAKEPEKRFQTAADFRDAIEMYCVGSEELPPGSIRVIAPESQPAPDPEPVVVPEPAPEPVAAPAPEPVAASVDSTGGGTMPPGSGTDRSSRDDGPSDRPSQTDPVFSAPRRSQGPGRGFVLTSLVTVVAMGAAVGVWLKFGGGFPPQDAQLEPPAAIVEDGDAITAVDTAPVVEETPAPPPVRLTLTVEPAAATVWVDDTLIVGADGASLPPGPHTVHAESEGYLPLDTVVELAADTSVAIALTRAPPTTGSVAVQASVPGRVLVDGRDRGAAPLRSLELRPGSYTVSFVPNDADALAEERSVAVTAGEASRVSFEITDALLSIGVRQPRWATVFAGEARLGDTPLIERRLPARVYQVRVEREGYVAQERLIRLEPGEHVEWVDIVLETEGE